MGASASKVEVLFEAVHKGSKAKVEKLLNEFCSTEEEKKQAVNFKSKDGRSPLIVAARKSYTGVAKLLLERGAHVNYVNSTIGSNGSALHEATKKGHKSMVELLVQHGASPFCCNDGHRTATDIAMMEGHADILHFFFSKAFWSTLLSHPYKRRLVVVMPHIPLGKHTHGNRRQVWIMKDASAIVPRVRLWLDGCGAYQVGSAGLDAIVRLHTSHVQPKGSLYTRYDRGYCFYVRPPAASTANANVIPDALAIQGLESFLSLVNLQGRLPQPYLNPSSGGGGVASAQSPVSLNKISLPTPPNAPQFPFARMPSLPSDPSFSTNPSNGGFAVSGGGASLSLPSGGQPGAAGPGRARSALGPPASVDSWVDSMKALPGESDPQFAARLSALAVPRGPRPAPALPPPPARAPGIEEEFAARLASAVTASVTGAPLPPPPASPQPGPSQRGGPPMTQDPSQTTAPSAPPMQPANDNNTLQGAGAPGRPTPLVQATGREEAILLHASSCRGLVPLGAPHPLCKQPVERITASANVAAMTSMSVIAVGWAMNDPGWLSTCHFCRR
eukprot:gene10786-16931_t